jgi:hypothetical protein
MCAKGRKRGHFLRCFFRQIQGVGSLCDRVVDENQMRRIGRRQISDRRQDRVLARPPLRIARRGSRARLHKAIAIRERLNRFIRGRGRVRRTQYGTGRFVESAGHNGANGTSGPIEHVPLFLRDGAGRGRENEKQCAFHDGDSPF